MSRLVLIVLVSALALGLVSTAAAKELTKAEACGQSGCAALQRDDRGDGLVELRGGARNLSPSPKLMSYYKLRFQFGGPAGQVPRAFTTLYVPSGNLVGAPGMAPGSLEWYAISGSVLEKVRDAVGRLEPFGPPKSWSAAIDEPARVVTLGAASAPRSDGRDWTPWLLTAAALVFVLGFGTFLARRLHIRRLTAA